LLSAANALAIRAAIRPCWLSLEMPPRDVDRHYMVERVRLSNIEVAIFIVVVAVAVALLLANR